MCEDVECVGYAWLMFKKRDFVGKKSLYDAFRRKNRPFVFVVIKFFSDLVEIIKYHSVNWFAFYLIIYIMRPLKSE